jgi:catechol 2,3-dioxygenase-like lactoylglutathione lyase family enzyme
MTATLGHLSFGVIDLERAVAFYDATLAPLGLTRVWTNEGAAGYGAPGGGDLLALKRRSGAAAPGPGLASRLPHGYQGRASCAKTKGS